jgi:predicted nucleotidyltransferase
MTTILEHLKEAIAKPSWKYSVPWRFTFGSALKDDARLREGDVDLIVEFAPMGRCVHLHAF